jgi:hypothetical protein
LKNLWIWASQKKLEGNVDFNILGLKLLVLAHHSKFGEGNMIDKFLSRRKYTTKMKLFRN